MSALDLTAHWPVGNVAAGWIDRSGRRATCGDTDRPFGLASVTKPLVATAVLVAIEEGSLALDGPAGPEGATLRHLLAHASGLGDRVDEPLAAVGARRIYSNAGFEVIGRELAAATGIPANRYLDEAVVEPLGLTATDLVGSPAHGARSSVDDLLALAAEWLRPTLLDPSTMAEATTTQFPHLIGVLPGYGRQDPNPWGLGFEIKGAKSPHWTGVDNSPSTYGHFGRAGTFVWVDPERGVACAVLTDRDFGSWAVPLWPALADAVLAEAARPAGGLKSPVTPPMEPPAHVPAPVDVNAQPRRDPRPRDAASGRSPVR
ncbi:MAG: serine hydrolase domain-containing protein [Acidimicrobiales bacterium]